MPSLPDYLHLDQVEWIDWLYHQAETDPTSIDASWRCFFEGMQWAQREEESGRDERVWQLIEAYRRYGHLYATVNPLHRPPESRPELQLSTFHLTPHDLEKSFPTYGVLPEERAPLTSLLAALEEIYCGTKSVEYRDIGSNEMEKWLKEQIEPSFFRPCFSLKEKQRILEALNKAELFETFLHTRYVGQKRFSLEGAETLIALLEGLLLEAQREGVEECVIGMAHRGRLNVLANVLKKSYSMVFGEFEDYIDPYLTEGTGDVKYHRGFSADVEVEPGKTLHVSLTSNPSHLESVDALVQGKAYAKQVRRGDEEKRRVLPLLIHGDGSLAGQGIVYETLQLSQLEGYGVGGSLHIVINNQIGFTTLPKEGRSSHYVTAIAKAFSAPVFHVNAEDPEGALLATLLAFRLRQRFHCDVFIDLICYRKYGHNEADEPAFTQPLEYQLIDKKLSIRELYKEHLIRQGFLEKEVALELEEEFKTALQKELRKEMPQEAPALEALAGVWQGYQRPDLKELFSPIETKIALAHLQEIGEKLCFIPSSLELHKQLNKLLEKRLKMVRGALAIDWAFSELLAFGSLLEAGTSIRLSGQDSQRGTFTQRHAIWIDQRTATAYSPLAHLQRDQGQFFVYNSPLSELAVLGFEFGYSLAAPETLVLWEAQFGDFANGAQVIFDQYLASAAQKWQRYSGLVVLLPHGYEGQGPEHSSGRLERFLQLAAEANLQIVYPTTPAQYFHLLRRQMKRPVRVPLIVFTPKGLLRHAECCSSLEELSGGEFSELLDDPTASKEAHCLIFCTGRFYYRLLAARQERNASHVALIRLEQLYPLPKEALRQLFARYWQAKKIFWAQEEPLNMGAFHYLYPEWQEIAPQVEYFGRPSSAATAVGSHLLHLQQEQQLIERIFHAARD